jgi:hypothetical protein
MHRLKFLLFIGILVGCNSKKKQPVNIENSVKQKTEVAKKLTGIEIVSKLDSLEFFNMTDQSELERAKNEMIESKNKLNYFSGTMRGETMDFTDNRFFSVDCEELFEIGGLTEYLGKVKLTFEKLDLELEYSNEKSEQTDNYWKHTIELNGKEYVAFDGAFSDYDWGIAYANFISMLNDQLKIQNSDNRFYPIRCDNGGEIVLLTNVQFKVIKNNYPNDNDNPQKLIDWKRKNGL